MPADGSFNASPDPTPEEAAALVAAIERFLADTAVAPAIADEVVSGWLRAALAEGVGGADDAALW